MHNGDERLRTGDRTTVWRRRGLRPPLLIALLVSLAVFCHSAFVVDAVVADSSAESSRVIRGQEGTPTHVPTCAVDGEPATLSKFREGTVWASRSLDDPAWFFMQDERPSETRPPLVTSSPGVRRALLQIFRI